MDELIPDGWWLTDISAKFILTVKVHRHHPLFIAESADAERGPSRNEQRSRKAAKVAEQRAEAKQQRLEAIDNRLDAQKRKLDLEEKIAGEYMLASKKKRETTSIKNWTATLRNCRTQLKDLESMKAMYIKRHGEAAYEEKYGELMDKYFSAEKELQDEGEVDVSNGNDEGSDEVVPDEEEADDSS